MLEIGDASYAGMTILCSVTQDHKIQQKRNDSKINDVQWPIIGSSLWSYFAREWQGGKGREIPILFFKWVLIVRIFLSIHSPSSSLGLILQGPSASCSHITGEWRPCGNFQNWVMRAFSKGRLCQCWGIPCCWSCIAANLHGQVEATSCSPAWFLILLFAATDSGKQLTSLYA